MYEIRPESIKTFITDRNVKLPRFQRKQTWDGKKNFQLCISLFKEYPLGVTIISVDESNGKTVRWLLDGRQRRNALLQMYDDPENIYNWAKIFIGFKNSDQPNEIEEKFNTKINEYIEADLDEEFDSVSDELVEDNTEGIDTGEEPSIKESSYGLDLLLDIIKIIHNKQKKNTGFTKPFDFTKYADRIPYVDNTGTGSILVSRRVKTFIDEYRRYCDDESLDYTSESSFFDFFNGRAIIRDESKIKSQIHSQWNAIQERILIIEKIDTLLTNSKIGVIEVKNLKSSDSQKIFNIINSEGEKLTAVEILSAKPHWNIQINNPSQLTIDAVTKLYKQIGTSNNLENVVRWDMPATLLKRLGPNIVFKEFSDSKTDFEKELTYGFKVMSCIYVGGVKKNDIEALSKVNTINWSTDVEELMYDLQNMLKLIASFSYFKYMKSWKSSMMDLTSDAVAINFIVMAYKDWIRKGKPLGDSKAKQFQKNCFILWDKSVWEHAYKLWRGASDQKIANNVSAINQEPEMYSPITTEKWMELLNEIFDDSTVDSVGVSQIMMKPLLYHFYCLSGIQGPDTECDIEVDHIIPQSLFNESSITNKDIIQHNLLNLGLLPKDENISKGNKKLILIENEWLKSQITKYEFIQEKDFVEYSNVNNYIKMFQFRRDFFDLAFKDKRDNILNN